MKQRDIQDVLISIFLYYISEQQIINSFLNNYQKNNKILHLLDKLKNHDKEFNFVFEFFEDAKLYAKVYPYTDAEEFNKDSIYLPLKINNKKVLQSPDQFGVFSIVL